jgi:hypothetical protein
MFTVVIVTLLSGCKSPFGQQRFGMDAIEAELNRPQPSPLDAESESKRQKIDDQLTQQTLARRVVVRLEPGVEQLDSHTEDRWHFLLLVESDLAPSTVLSKVTAALMEQGFATPKPRIIAKRDKSVAISVWTPR